MQTAKLKILTVAETRGNAHAEPVTIQKRIGSTVYEVRMHFNPDAKETMDGKVLRLIRNDLNKPLHDAKMTIPQTSRLSERSA